MKLAIMQPYFFPYIGYFQLIYAVDKFVFYDDVQFIKSGWINRNFILEKGERKLLLTLHLDGASANKKINETRVRDNSVKIIKSIELNYSKAPFYNLVFPMIEEVIKQASARPLISEIAALSVQQVSTYLGLKTKFEKSSLCYPETISLGRVKRLTAICKEEKAEIYTNPLGGKDLYSKEEFLKYGVKLFFIKSNNIKYHQFDNIFVPNLSIIDVIMFNSPERVLSLLESFNLQ